eukprot:3132047-Prymnesium_polylepis.1
MAKSAQWNQCPSRSCRTRACNQRADARAQAGATVPPPYITDTVYPSLCVSVSVCGFGDAPVHCQPVVHAPYTLVSTHRYSWEALEAVGKKTLRSTTGY